MSTPCATCPHANRCTMPTVLRDQIEHIYESLDAVAYQVMTAHGFPQVDGVRFEIAVDTCLHHPDAASDDLDTVFEILLDDVYGEGEYTMDFVPLLNTPEAKTFEAGLRQRLIAGEDADTLRGALGRALEPYEKKEE